MLKIAVATLPHFDGLQLPRFQTASSSGMDLRAAIEGELTLEPGQRHLVPTGLRIAIPKGYEGQVRPRSGLAVRHGLSLVNTPGTIDADYRGEIKLPLINLGQESIRITRGMRVAQLVFAPVVQAEWEPVQELPASLRGRGGFGHTGTQE